MALSAQLFGGFSHQALKGLDDLLRHPQSDQHERACAYWALARWHAVQKQPAEAVRYLHLLRRTSSHDGAMLRPRLLEIDCLLELGATAEALNAIFAASSTFGKLGEIEYALANAYHGLGDSDAQLSWLNAPLIRSALGSIQRRDPALPLALSNIVVPSAGAVQDTTAGKVSVLLPAYNCATTLPFALDSILKQTWSNLEVLVVDDASSDETWCVIQRFASQDARVVPLRQDSNRGAYCCRNTALSKATGELVTIHDSDDWSHPEKLALQIRHLLETNSVFNVSYAVRVSTDLRVLVDPTSGRVVRPNISSLMVRQEGLRELGGWDEVRIGADGELISRLRTRYGQKPKGPLPDTALSFVLSSPTSLTSQSVTGLRSLRFGARREYKEAYQNWHYSEVKKEKPNFYMPRAVRPFPIPKIMRVDRKEIDDYQVVFVSDFHSESILQINMAMIVSADKASLEYAILHWPRRTSAQGALPSALRDLMSDRMVTTIVPGDNVVCEQVVVSDPLCLLDVPETLPRVSARSGFILRCGADSAIEETISKHFHEVFRTIPAFADLNEIEEALVAARELNRT